MLKIVCYLEFAIKRILKKKVFCNRQTQVALPPELISKG